MQHHCRNWGNSHTNYFLGVRIMRMIMDTPFCLYQHISQPFVRILYLFCLKLETKEYIEKD